ncbi:MAG: fibrobacter succinogenes major paralogous domain-containing protein, partial [Bacteroidales bacterium]
EACPDGWHLPADDEWKSLEKYLGMSTAEADKIHWRFSGNVGTQLKSSLGWPIEAQAGHSSLFRALPGGAYSVNGGFSTIGDFANFWSSTSDTSPLAWGRGLQANLGGVNRFNWDQGFGLSVRCIKDN